MRRTCVALGVAAWMAACSSSSAPGTATCGAGTTLAGSQCVAVDASVTDSAGTPDTIGNEGATVEAGADAPQDVTVDSWRVDAEAGPPASDACPSGSGSVTILDCDPSCAGSLSTCLTASCGGGPMALPQNSPVMVVRTPDAPGTDPACTAACAASGYAYGLGFTFPGIGPVGAVLITVGPPWEIVIGGDPYCDYYDAGQGSVTQGCVSADWQGGDSFFIMTKDPNAAARNITISFTSTLQVCPPDGGV